MAEAAYENPLIPHARLRQLYRAMLQLRAVGKALPAKARGGWSPGLEAAMAATSVDLTAADLVSDALHGGALDFLRGATLAQALSGTGKPRGKRSPKLDCGAASTLAPPPSLEQRLWQSLGAAAALQAQAELARETAAAAGEETTPESRVVALYVHAAEVPAALWRTLLPAAAAQVLPLIVIVLPPATTGTASPVSPLALRCAVPGIQVDAQDAVALYRVMQESLVRARMGGGAALIECVPFVLAGATGRRARPADAVETIAQYMLTRRVVTPAWLAAEAASFARRLSAARPQA